MTIVFTKELNNDTKIESLTKKYHQGELDWYAYLDEVNLLTGGPSDIRNTQKQRARRSLSILDMLHTIRQINP